MDMRKELVGVLVSGLSVMNEITAGSGARNLAAIITGGQEAIYVDELCKRYEQALGFIMYEQKLTPVMLIEESREYLRRAFDANIAGDSRDWDDALTIEERFAEAIAATLRRLEAIYQQMGEVYYGVKQEPVAPCRADMTPYAASFSSINPDLPPDTKVEVELDDGTLQQGEAGELCWGKGHDHPMIIGFRILEATH